jgi:cysteinyl-tRNA synthetase
VGYWVHGQHLLADGTKMAKSAGNVFLLDDLAARGFDPLAFRYLCLTVRYRHRMNFTFTALKASEKALTALRHRVWTWKSLGLPQAMTPEGEEWRQRFWAAVEDDLDLPTGLALTWEMVRSELPEADKLALLLEFDQVFGLDLDRVPAAYRLPGSVAAAVQHRQSLRQQADYSAADLRRAEVQAGGYRVEDTGHGARVRPKSTLEQREELWPSVSSGREVESLLDQPARFEFTFLLNAYDYQSDVERCVDAMLRYSRGYSAEIVVVDNGSTDGSAQWLESMQLRQPNLRVIHCDHVLGDAAGKNIGVKQSLGANLVLLDSSTEIVGDVLDTIRRRLADPSVGVFGPYGLTSTDFRHFHEDVVEGEADAVQGYCMAFRREAVGRVGLMRECFRFYRNLDIDYCFQFKEKGYRIVADGRLPLVRHEHRQWAELDQAQRDELSRKNFGRFLKRWGNRPDLLVARPAAPAHGHDHDHDQHDHQH